MDWIVLEMAFKNGLSMPLERISSVFAVVVKHLVMLFKRIWVGVTCGAIFDCPSPLLAFYSVPGKFHLRVDLDATRFAQCCIHTIEG